MLGRCRCLIWVVQNVFWIYLLYPFKQSHFSGRYKHILKATLVEYLQSYAFRDRKPDIVHAIQTLNTSTFQSTFQFTNSIRKLLSLYQDGHTNIYPPCSPPVDFVLPYTFTVVQRNTSDASVDSNVDVYLDTGTLISDKGNRGETRANNISVWKWICASNTR